ncbi:putative MFS family arabinose efflux permease [Kribbella amoyensis]|uniref:Putative MFS family arabinose efflux permease n=1 Tax=Kribbella amoyensis TaxID=996641 RepID=A0A561C0M5_9ACTN|nr:MFS transporter [Kribbella amoyensis]TWD84705.1 putative MFS family arabinose efflux permease [Kribbella amoyensis]
MAATVMVRRALASLHGNRPFRLLWFSNLFFFGGVWTQTLVLGWLVYETTRSELLVAVYTAARLAPMLLGPFAGAFADRHNRVRLLTIACAWALVAVSAVAALTSLTRPPYWALVVGGLAVGLAQSPSQPARASLVLDLVGRRNLSNANALNSMAMNMTQVVGPAVGGLMISGLGAPAALWISTVWYAISLVLLLPLRGLGQVAHERSASAVQSVVSGLRAIVRNRLATAVLLVTLAANTLLWPIYQSFMPVFAQESLGLDAAGLGWLLTCGGVGGLIGSLVIAGMGDFRHKGAMFVVGTAGWGTLWALFAVSRNPVVSFVLMGAIGLMSAAFGVLQTTLLLITTEPHLHGRALGVQELAIGIMPVAALGLGALAEHFGLAATTFVAAVLLVVCLVALTVWTPQLLNAELGSSADRPAATPSDVLSG